eukprot:TRINITY_DN2152_c0_g4_i1.p1 TRINITY_DN2152_c0_g4~~TRINITY_DN2152_c0_g4_i1.p1  ORF type:complete len:107 (+),score=0.96 TRINITY_DN2152_c0_g4_i1:426-746(+)
MEEYVNMYPILWTIILPHQSKLFEVPFGRIFNVVNRDPTSRFPFFVARCNIEDTQKVQLPKPQQVSNNFDWPGTSLLTFIAVTLVAINRTCPTVNANSSSLAAHSD